MGLIKSLFGRKPKEHKFEAKGVQRPKRVDKMTNLLFESAGGGRLQQPDPKVVDLIKKQEPKIRYLPVADGQAFKESTTKMQSFEDYNAAVLALLDAQIKQDFPSRVLSLRGIQTALNGSIKTGDTVVLDVIDVVRIGKEASTPEIKGVRVEGGFNTSSRDPITGYFPGLYVVKNKQFRDRLATSGRQDEVFPAMLVYDQAKLNLKPDYFGDEGYRHMFEGDPYESVLALYILDAPVFG